MKIIKVTASCWLICFNDAKYLVIEEDLTYEAYMLQDESVEYLTSRACKKDILDNIVYYYLRTKEDEFNSVIKKDIYEDC